MPLRRAKPSQTEPYHAIATFHTDSYLFNTIRQILLGAYFASWVRSVALLACCVAYRLRYVVA